MRKQPNSWTCLPTSYSIILDIELKDFLDVIGHDGSQKIYEKGKPERGFEPQECMDAALRFGWATTLFELEYHISNGVALPRPIYAKDRVIRLIRETEGIIFCKPESTTHAVANRQGTVIDPNGTTYPFSEKLNTLGYGVLSKIN